MMSLDEADLLSFDGGRYAHITLPGGGTVICIYEDKAPGYSWLKCPAV